MQKNKYFESIRTRLESHCKKGLRPVFQLSVSMFLNVSRFRFVIGDEFILILLLLRFHCL